MNTVHIPILLQPIVDALIEPFFSLPDSAPPHWIMDCTLGGGGHTAAFLAALKADPRLARHRVVSVDQDLGAIERARIRFQKEISDGRLELVHSRFADTEALVQSRPVLGLMADLGFSSDQIEDAGRGMSFQTQGPLDMRLNPSEGQSCAEFLKQVSESELESILREYGEERFSRRIAASIITRRAEGRCPATTQELVDAVVRAVPPAARHGRIHVATRTFQALRIVVNEELSQLDELLNRVIIQLVPRGRVAILSFHSLEDRRVKNRFKEKEFFTPLTKKPIQADDEEMKRNPRSRSAKLRIAELHLPGKG